MNTFRLQARLDQLLATSRHRWLLSGIAVGSIVFASALIARATPFTDTWIVYCVAVLALVVASEPAEQLGTVVMAIVIGQWISLGESVASPWTLAFALCLHVFHSSVALMAVMPHAASLHSQIVRRWVGRSGMVLVGTGAVWLLANGFERQQAPGNVVLTAVAFAVLAAAAVVFRSRSLPTE